MSTHTHTHTPHIHTLTPTLAAKKKNSFTTPLIYFDNNKAKNM